MKRKVFVGIVMLMLSFVQNTFAEPLINENSITREMKIVRIYGTADRGEVVGYSLVLKNTDADDIRNLFAVGDVKTDENGEFSIIFKFYCTKEKVRAV